MNASSAPILKFVERVQKQRAATADSMETIVKHITGKASETGVNIYGNLIDEANRLDAYDYILRGFGIGDHHSRRDMPDGYTIDTATPRVLLEAAQSVLEGLRIDLIQQARSPRVRSSHEMNAEYFYTLGSSAMDLESAVACARRCSEQEG